MYNYYCITLNGVIETNVHALSWKHENKNPSIHEHKIGTYFE